MPAKKGGRPDRKEACSVHTEPGDNAKYLRHSMTMFDWPKTDLSDGQAVRNRVNEYFALCEQDDMKPSVSGLAFALGMDRRRLWEIVSDNDRHLAKLSDSARDFIKKAYEMLTIQMENYMQNGKINPVAGIFLMKNNMGYKDQQEIQLAPSNPLGNSATPAELQAKYQLSIESGDSIDSD